MGDGWYSAKLYDYIGSARPILAMADNDGIVARLIQRTNSGVTASTLSGLKDALLGLYEEYIRNGSTGYCGRPDEIAALTRRSRTAELAGILDSISV